MEKENNAGSARVMSSFVRSHSRPERISKHTWEGFRGMIEQLYRENDLESVMKLMESKHGFKANKRQYCYQLRKWDIRKYKSYSRTQNENGKETDNRRLRRLGPLNPGGHMPPANIPSDPPRPSSDDMLSFQSELPCLSADSGCYVSEVEVSTLDRVSKDKHLEGALHDGLATWDYLEPEFKPPAPRPTDRFGDYPIAFQPRQLTYAEPSWLSPLLHGNKLRIRVRCRGGQEADLMALIVFNISNSELSAEAARSLDYRPTPIPHARPGKASSYVSLRVVSTEYHEIDTELNIGVVEHLSDPFVQLRLSTRALDRLGLLGLPSYAAGRRGGKGARDWKKRQGQLQRDSDMNSSPFFRARLCSALVETIAREIFAKAQLGSQQSKWPALANALPMLVEALVSRLSQESASQYQDIVRHIWNRSTVIVQAVDNLVKEATGQSKDAQRDRRMWLADNWLENGEPGKADTYQGMKLFGFNYAEGDPLDIQQDSTWYMELLQNTAAYEWFLRHTQREVDSTNDSRAMVSIRSTVLETLPQKLVGRWDGLSWHPHSATFHIPAATRQSFADYNVDDKFTVIVAGSRQYSCSVREYAEFAWPEIGPSLLEFLQGKKLQAELPDHTILEFDEAARTFRLKVSGTAYSIVECGQLLAWLSVVPEYEHSFLPSVKTERSMVEATPEVVRGLFSMAGYANSVVFRLEAKEVALSPVEVAGKGFDADLDQYLGCTVHVHGYSLPGGRKKTRGLELSRGALRRASRSQSEYLGGDFLLVFGSKFEVAGWEDGIYYWHRVDSGAKLRCPGQDDPKGRSPPLLDDKSRFRHVLLDCCGSREISSPYPRGDSDVSVSTRELSFDEDILSVSSDSVDADSQHLQSKGFKIAREVFRQVFSAACVQPTSFGSHGSGECGSGAGGAGWRTSSEQGRQRLGIPEQPSGRKRPMPESNSNGEEDDGDNDTTPSKKTKPSDGSRLACPFYKKDQVAHWQCFSKKLGTIPYLKSHLYRRHTPGFFCQMCKQIFHCEAALTNHLQAGCVFVPDAKLDGITPQQKTQLSRYSFGTTEEKWYSVWDIVFPSHPRPLSIYVEVGEREVVARMEMLILTDGVAFLRNALDDAGLWLRTDVSQEILSQALQTGMRGMFEHFRLHSLLGQASAATPQSSIGHGVPSGGFQALPTPSAESDSTPRPSSNRSSMRPPGQAIVLPEQGAADVGRRITEDAYTITSPPEWLPVNPPPSEYMDPDWDSWLDPVVRPANEDS